MDNVENGIANNTQRPGGGASLIDVHPLLDSLKALKTTTDAAGNVQIRMSRLPSATMIDDEITNIKQCSDPGRPGARSNAANQDQRGELRVLNSTQTPNLNAQQAQDIPALQTQIQQMKAMQMDANIRKVPFNVLRQMKTLQSYDVNPQTGMPTLNGHMGGKVLDAYRDTLQQHVNSLDPQLGATYQALERRITRWLPTASRAIKGQSNEGSLTSMLQRGLGSPSAVRERHSHACLGPGGGQSRLRQQGNNTKGGVRAEELSPGCGTTCRQRRNSSYTQTYPDAARPARQRQPARQLATTTFRQRQAACRKRSARSKS